MTHTTTHPLPRVVTSCAASASRSRCPGWSRCPRSRRPRPPASAAASGPPLRLGIVYFSNGVEPAHWWAKGSGATMELGPGLPPMLPHREDMVFIRGLFNQSALASTSPHLGRMNLLSGAPVSLDPDVIRVGTSMDQVIAGAIGDRTAVPSLVLGIEPNELRLEDGLSMVYGSSLSWVSPTRPATKEIYPARTFDRLVGDGTGRAARPQHPRRGAGRVAGASDRGSVAPITTSSASTSRASATSRSASSGPRRRSGSRAGGRRWRSPTCRGPKHELPQDVPAHMKLMLDLIVLAFQMDKTRVATVMLNNDLSQMNFKFVEGVQGALHLDLTHNGRVPTKEAMYLKTNQFHIAQFAYLTERMKSISEGESTLLDNSILMCASSLFDGDLHSAEQLPILLTGKGSGTLRTGRILDYMDKGDANRKVCSLHLSLMDRMGVKLDGFGDASSRLEDL